MISIFFEYKNTIKNVFYSSNIVLGRNIILK